MTAWRPTPIRQDEIRRDTEEQKQGAGSQPVTTAQIIEQSAAHATAKPRGLGDAIKRLFGEVKKTLTRKPVAPKPKRRRKRGENTRSLYKKLAIKILIPFARSVFHQDFTWFLPPDELDETQRLMMRQWQRQDDSWQQDNNQALRSDQPNHLSPHL